MTDVVSFDPSSFVDAPRYGGSYRVLSPPRELASETQVEVDFCLGRAGPGGDAVPREQQVLPGAWVDRRPAASIRATQEVLDPDPSQGVADVDCRLHGIRNLCVASS